MVHCTCDARSDAYSVAPAGVREAMTRCGSQEIERPAIAWNDLHWQAQVEPIHSNAGSLGVGAMPGSNSANSGRIGGYGGDIEQVESPLEQHPALREKETTTRSRSGSGERRVASGESLGSNYGGEVQPPYPMTEAERRQVAEAGVI